MKNRPRELYGTTEKMKTGCGNMYVTINADETGKPFEIFTKLGKAGGCGASQNESMSRLVSMALRSGITADKIIKQLSNISCDKPARDAGERILSCADAIAKALQRNKC